MGVPEPGRDRPGAGGPADERLAALIRDGLAVRSEHPVDIEGLLDGARTGARRIRRRRRVATRVAVAAVVLGVLPVAVSGLQAVTGVRHTTSDAAEAASGASNDARAAAPAPSLEADKGLSFPGPEPSASGTQPGSLLSEPNPIKITDAAVLSADVLPEVDLGLTVDQPVTDDIGPTVQRVCRTPSTAVEEVAAGRQVGYVETGRTDAWSLTTLVRVLPKNAADTEVDQLRQSMGYCASDLQLKRAALNGVPGDGVALGYQLGALPQRPHAVLVVGVVRQGRATASVELVVPARAAPDSADRIQLALDEARRLLALADQRLISSGLVHQARNDPRLS